MGNSVSWDQSRSAPCRYESGKLAGRVENFAIAFDPAGTSCTMHLDWETTRASIRYFREEIETASPG